MIGETAALTDKAREGAFREGTEIPYITYPMETTMIVSAFTDNEGIIAAAPFHDVMEDTRVTREESEDALGSEVASLAVDESEDKGRSWQERRTHTIRHPYTVSWETKILVLGGRLSNTYCMVRDCLMVDDAIWQRFNKKDKRGRARYYRGVTHALRELEGHLYFKEYMILCRAVFGEDIISSDKGIMQREYE